MLATFALVIAPVIALGPAGKQYAEMRAQTQANGRGIEATLRTMVLMGKRVDECILIAAPKDQDWEGEYVNADGTRTSLKMGFDDQNQLLWLSMKNRTELPVDPHLADAPVPLKMPVWDRPVVAFSGGPGRMWNSHVFNPDQRHAVDLVSWKDGGSYAQTQGVRPEDFVVWNAEVHAPADGTVILVENAADDHRRPGADWADDAHPFGNSVVIRIDGSADRFIVLGHMKKGSVVVKPGQQVKAGDVVGRVGNSGNTSEPHLHLHVQDWPILKQGYSVPFTVDGKEIRRGNMIEPTKRP